jgi:hypothetical protein
MKRSVVNPAITEGAQERAEAGSGFLGWLGRRLSALEPRTRRHWALYGALFIAALFLLFVWRSSSSYSAQVLVIDETGVVGLSPYTDRLDFGDLPRGGSATMPMTLENSGPLPARFAIVATGDIRQFIEMSDAFFVLDPGETKTVEFVTVVPGSAEAKKYTGKVYVVRMPWFPWP